MFCERLFICALWSPAGKGLTSWLSFVVSSVGLSLSHWYPGSGVVLDCIDSWSLHYYLLLQTKGYDCGLYAVANATTLAYGKDPKNTGVYPKANEMSLENRHLEPFPIISSKVKWKPHRNVVDVPLFCLCRMPDTHTLYIYCDTCDWEYHPQCVGLNISISDSTDFKCQNCNINNN